MALRILDDAIQAHGGGGVTIDFGLAHADRLEELGEDEMVTRRATRTGQS